MTPISKWEISSEGKMIWKGGNKIRSSLNILHLDDHQLYKRGVKEAITNFFPSAIFTGIDNGDTALEKVKQCITEDTIPDLIITDINHPGLPGHEFIKQVRDFEQLQKRQTAIPILVISMLDAGTIISRLGSSYATKSIRILSKADGSHEIAEAIDELLYS